MSDINKTTSGDDIKIQPRVAYTLNNHQPVECTYIGSQPLFYMDFEHRYEDVDDILLDAADYGIFENELNVLKRELDSFDSVNFSSALSTEKKVETFFMNSDFITGQHKKDQVELKEFIALLKKSRLAAGYVETAEKYGIEICFSGQIETALYDRQAGKIFINPEINETDRVFLAIRELRRHYQHRAGALINPLTFHPDNAVLVHRAQSADLIVSVIRAAWELQLSGYKEAWEHIENSSMADLGRAFAREAYLDFRTINNGQAMAAVFEAWFLSERCRSQDKILINQMLSDHQGYVFEFKESESILTPAIIAALGELPFGKNYLAEHAVTIMDDAIFTDVRDRANANFLWFIKFERSFRETEQELQTKGTSENGAASGAKSSKVTQGKNNEQSTEASAQIISFNFGADTASDSASKTKSGKKLVSKQRKAAKSDKGSISNVVYLRRWSGE
ncbi:MAG: hypothetical protein KTR28_05055 [Micavibrio sp.]|nr:hypothetical protein [Micavibrio sp.]